MNYSIQCNTDEYGFKTTTLYLQSVQITFNGVHSFEMARQYMRVMFPEYLEAEGTK